MLGLAALVLATSVVAAGPDPRQAPDPFADGTTPAKPRHRLDAASRWREAQEHKNTFFGLMLETGAALCYFGTAGMTIGRDIDLPPEGCHAPSKPCSVGTPIFVVIPLGATTMGIFGASRFAAAREASLWRSPLFWAGTAVALSAYLAWAKGSDSESRNQGLAWDTTGLTLGVLGTAMQVWGALVAPPRDSGSDEYAFHLLPGCGPTVSRGLVCGVTWAGR